MNVSANNSPFKIDGVDWNAYELREKLTRNLEGIEQVEFVQSIDESTGKRTTVKQTSTIVFDKRRYYIRADLSIGEFNCITRFFWDLVAKYFSKENNTSFRRFYGVDLTKTQENFKKVGEVLRERTQEESEEKEKEGPVDLSFTLILQPTITPVLIRAFNKAAEQFKATFPNHAEGIQRVVPQVTRGKKILSRTYRIEHGIHDERSRTYFWNNAASRSRIDNPISYTGDQWAVNVQGDPKGKDLSIRLPMQDYDQTMFVYDKEKQRITAGPYAHPVDHPPIQIKKDDCLLILNRDQLNMYGVVVTSGEECHSFENLERCIRDEGALDSTIYSISIEELINSKSP